MDKLKGRAGKQVYFKLTNYFLDTNILKRCSWTSAKQTQEKAKKVFLDRLRTSWKHCNTTNHHFIRYTCSTPGQQTMSERSHSPKHGGSQVTVLDSQSGRSIHRSILIQSHYWDVVKWRTAASWMCGWKICNSWMRTVYAEVLVHITWTKTWEQCSWHLYEGSFQDKWKKNK